MTKDVRIELVDEAQKRGDWKTAKNLLIAILSTVSVENKEGDKHVSILQRLALVTYKSKYPSEKEALLEAATVLRKLDPQNSDDPETIGMWGAIHKRLWGLTGAYTLLEEAVHAYERGFTLRNDYYNGINFAYLLNVCATQVGNKAEAIADFVQAGRVRQKVLIICRKWLEGNPVPYQVKNQTSSESMEKYLESRYWVLATMSEAYTGLEQHEKAGQILEEAYKIASQKWMQETTGRQIERLKQLITDSPSRYIKED
jgi:tetratricopeptide (TPR) repeat protein